MQNKDCSHPGATPIQFLRQFVKKKERKRGKRKPKGALGDKSHAYLSLFHEKFGLNTIIRDKSTDMF